MQKIMVIDDEIEILDMLNRYFSLEGYDVITAAGGKEALLKLGKQQPDIILLVINMPDLDGLSLCKNIRDLCPLHQQVAPPCTFFSRISSLRSSERSS